ncbi:TraB/GumN family protein [Taibaiella soli]|uniref:TraB/GumN family protein n=1 Tax=Taibaiella soli TaxID=1649169 RepID=A0A2W2AEB3_9BACT|nr:TraB/GumN family protein [Taibaiella soli]PZF73631.1 TraB/GumN family protein [Taibaiella soli]
MKPFLVACFILFASFFCRAQKTATVNGHSLLWRIEGKGLSKPSYLFGTIHIICSDDYLWTDKMKQCLHAADKVCLEMDMDDPALLTEIATGMVDKDGKQLKDYFTPEEYKKISDYMRDSIGTDIRFIQQMKPAILLSLFASKSLDCPSQVSYESNIMEDAKKDNKEIIGLEAAKEQLDLLNDIPADSIVKEVLASIDQPADTRQEYAALVAAYKAQDLPKLYDLIQNSRDVGEDTGEFLDARNKKWISRISEKVKNNSVFFAVGAGHLWGKNGVIQLLKDAGYKVTPVY